MVTVGPDGGPTRQGWTPALTFNGMSDTVENLDSAFGDGRRLSDGAAREVVDQDPPPSPASDFQVQGSGRAEDTPAVSHGPHSEAEAVTAGAVVEALLFSSDAPLSAARLASLLDVGDAGDVKGHIAALNDRYAREGASFRIEAIAGGYQMLTLPAYKPWIAKLHKARSESRLSKAALETLAIVAYRQPILRADIEAIRGVAVGDMLVRLREMNLVKIAGRAEEIGRPLLYGTTRKFLEVFGLASLKDLPRIEDEESQAVPQLKVVREP